MALITMYRGFEIRYSELNDEWACHALALTGKTLSALKAKILDEDKKTRRVGNVKALKFQRWDKNPIAEVTITLIEDREQEVVWITEGKSRAKVHLRDLMLDTPGVRELIDELQNLKAAAKKALAKADTFEAAIPRVTMADLGTVEQQPLVKVTR